MKPSATRQAEHYKRSAARLAKSPAHARRKSQPKTRKDEKIFPDGQDSVNVAGLGAEEHLAAIHADQFHRLLRATCSTTQGCNLFSESRPGVRPPYGGRASPGTAAFIDIVVPTRQKQARVRVHRGRELLGIQRQEERMRE